MSSDAAALPEEPAALKAMIAALRAANDRMAATLRAHDLLVQALRMRIARLQKQKFGPSSEKIEREIEQLELALEDLQMALAEVDGTAGDEVDEPAPAEPEQSKPPRRRPRVSESTPRERREIDPGDTCPECGGELRVVGEDVSELLDLIAARLKVIEIARVKKSCRRCESERVRATGSSGPANGAEPGAEPSYLRQHGRCGSARLRARLEVR